MNQQHAIVIARYRDIDVPFTDDGWFNATAVAARYRKRPVDWLRLPETKRYIEAMKNRSEKIPLLKTVRGGRGKSDATWIHPKLAVRFAQWLDVDFAIWCDEQIDALLRGTHPHFDHKRLCHEAASSYKVMSQILQEARLTEGKSSAPHHFMNEAKMVNWTMCGQFAGRNRDTMSVEELDVLAKLEIRNAVMIGRGMPYDERKKTLNVCATAWRTSKPRLASA